MGRKKCRLTLEEANEWEKKRGHEWTEEERKEITDKTQEAEKGEENNHESNAYLTRSL